MIKPHAYWPSHPHMGDCGICGNRREHPIHEEGQMTKRKEYECMVCGMDVYATQQYMIGHEFTPDGRVIHTVTHFDCLISPSQGSGSSSNEVAASTSRSK